jgi:hypothetical protein
VAYHSRDHRRPRRGGRPRAGGAVAHTNDGRGSRGWTRARGTCSGRRSASTASEHDASLWAHLSRSVWRASSRHLAPGGGAYTADGLRPSRPHGLPSRKGVSRPALHSLHRHACVSRLTFSHDATGCATVPLLNWMSLSAESDCHTPGDQVLIRRVMMWSARLRGKLSADWLRENRGSPARHLMTSVGGECR